MDQPNRPSRRVRDVVVLTTAMLTFISFWRAGAIVLCDMASSAYYAGGIAEVAVGRAAPWFILAVMAFSACILAVYVEASAMFVRGGVYKIVRRAMGPPLAKVSVSALMFSYVLTGPISAVSAGQYLAGLLNSLFPILRIGWHVPPNLFSVVFALAVTLYFWRENIRGIEESSGKSLFIIQMTTAMALLLFGWSAYTLSVRGFSWPPLSLSFGKDAWGWLEHAGWLKAMGLAGVLVGFGHAFLGMSGAETLAQVYREIEAPKLTNLKRAAAFIFLFAFLLTGGMTLLASSIIPEPLRPEYLDDLLSGLAMSQEIKRTHPQVQILVTTAYSDTQYLLHAIEIGIDGYVLKPVDVDRLLTLVQRNLAIVDHQRQETQHRAAQLQLLKELQETATKITTLSGLLPICAGCKKIRNDQGYWTQIETFIAQHADVSFTHGLCPPCLESLYPEHPKAPGKKK